MTINEIIVVEGRDDTAAVGRAVQAETIETHGFGITEETWERIARAAEGPGIIILTDPDHAGEMIRRKITQRFPEAAQAYLPRRLALKKGDIGVENASPEAIQEALSAAHCTEAEVRKEFTMQDMTENGLTGGSGSRHRRALLGEALGIGYGNARTMLSRLNGYGITREEFYGALQSISD